MTKTITNKDYYYMIENQIRTEMPKFEVGKMLSIAETLIKKSNILEKELIEYPIEGYYYKTEKLCRYFKIIRNLQHNKNIFKKVVHSPELTELQDICQNNLFGEEKPYPVADWNDAPLKRRYDILTLTMEDKSIFDESSRRPWNIEKIMDGCKQHFNNRVNLVELAYLSGEPECLCCGAETNSLYRMYAMYSGYFPGQIDYVWDVSAEMEYAGEKLIKEYNFLIGSSMVVPTIFNHNTFNKEPETPRVALLGEILLTGEKYYWILENNRFYDFYSINTITTESLAKTPVIENL